MVRIPRAVWLIAAALAAPPCAFAVELPPEPTEAQVRAAYQHDRDTWRSRYAGEHAYDVRHIVVASEAQAKAVLTSLMRGEKFADLARTLSKDSGSAEKGGSLGWSWDGQFVEPFAAVVRKLAPAGLALEPVRVGSRWHVVEVMGVRDLVFPEYEDVQDLLRTKLRQHWQEYDQSSIYTREVDLRSVTSSGDSAYFRYRERVTFGSRPERTVRSLAAVVDCARRERADLETDGPTEMRSIYPGTAQDSQMKLVCERAVQLAALARSAQHITAASDADLGCDEPAPHYPATVRRDGRFTGTAVVVRGEITAPSGAVGDVFVDVSSGFESIDNAAVRAFQAMQCKPRSPMPVSQWVQRSFVILAGGVGRTTK